MAYPKHLLNEGEEIVLDRRPHWIFLSSGLFMIALAVIVFVIVTVFAPSLWPLAAVLVVICVLGTAGRFLQWTRIDFVVTTDRIITRRGILSKVASEIPLDRVTNISHRRSLFERMVGAGDLVIESAGERSAQLFTDVADPVGVQNLVSRQSELYQGRGAPSRVSEDGAGPRRSSISVAEQLEKLVTLRDRGVLSDAEFEQQKRAVLRR